MNYLTSDCTFVWLLIFLFYFQYLYFNTTTYFCICVLFLLFYCHYFMLKHQKLAQFMAQNSSLCYIYPVSLTKLRNGRNAIIALFRTNQDQSKTLKNFGTFKITFLKQLPFVLKTLKLFNTLGSAQTRPQNLPTD